MYGFCWPFRSKVPSQYRRIDQGWDLQGVGPEEETCVAIADGTVRYAHDPGSNGAHFGDPYPVLWLNSPLPQARAIYYGHTHPTVPEGTHVRQGVAISKTSTPGGGGAPGRWLEIGAWINGPTGNGQWMHDALVLASVFGPPVPTERKRMDYVVSCTDTNHSGAQFLWRADGETLPFEAPVEAQSALDAGARHLTLTPATFDAWVHKHVT